MESPEMEVMMKKMNYPIAKVRADPSAPRARSVFLLASILGAAASAAPPPSGRSYC